jgi:hypothetical protein
MSDIVFWVWLGGWVLLVIAAAIEDVRFRNGATGLALALGSLWPLMAVLGPWALLWDHVIYPGWQRYQNKRDARWLARFKQQAERAEWGNR